MLATDEAFYTTTETSATPRSVRQAAALQLSRDYWTTSNSARMQAALTERLLYASDWEDRVVFLKAANQAGAIGLQGAQDALNRYISWGITEIAQLPREGRTAAQTAFVQQFTALLTDLGRKEWAAPDIDWAKHKRNLRALRHSSAQSCKGLFKAN